MKIKEKEIILDCVNIYENNMILFNEFDYQLSRYNINYSIAILKFKNSFTEQELIDIKSATRVADKVVKIDKNIFLILFFHTNEKQAYTAILALERKIYKLFPFLDIFFKCSIVEVKKGESSRHKLDVACSLINSCTDNEQHIITEEMVCEVSWSRNTKKQ